MKNIQTVNELQQCHYCKLKGFFSYTPQGGDYDTCPCCGGPDLGSTIDISSILSIYNPHIRSDIRSDSIEKDEEEFKKLGYTIMTSDEFDINMIYQYNYCNHCKIIFETGCQHSSQGCTSDVYNAHLVKKWKNKVTNMEYDGMPYFDNEDDWSENVNNVEVLEMVCANHYSKCENTYYPIREDRECSLCPSFEPIMK